MIADYLTRPDEEGVSYILYAVSITAGHNPGIIIWVKKDAEAYPQILDVADFSTMRGKELKKVWLDFLMQHDCKIDYDHSAIPNHNTGIKQEWDTFTYYFTGV